MVCYNVSVWKPPLAFAAHSFFQIPPRKKSEWRGAARREGATRGTPRVAGFRGSPRNRSVLGRVQATTHAERAKWVRAECRIRSHSETSAGVRANEPRACGARRSGRAKCMRRVRANSEGGQNETEIVLSRIAGFVPKERTNSRISA